MKRYLVAAAKTIPYIAASAVALLAIVAFGRFALHRQATYTGVDPKIVALLPSVKSAAISIGIPITKEMQHGPKVPDKQNAAPLYKQLDDLLTNQPLGKDQKLLDTLADNVSYGAGIPAKELPSLDLLLARHRDLLALVHEIVKRPENEKAVHVSASTGDYDADETDSDKEDSDKDDEDKDNEDKEKDEDQESNIQIAAKLLSLESLAMLQHGYVMEAVTDQANLFRIVHHAASWSAGDGFEGSSGVMMQALSGLQAILNSDPHSGIKSDLANSSLKSKASDAILTLCYEHRKDYDPVAATKLETGTKISMLEKRSFRQSLPMMAKIMDSHGKIDPSAIAEDDAGASSVWNSKADEAECLLLQRTTRVLPCFDEPFSKALAEIRAAEPGPKAEIPTSFSLDTFDYVPFINLFSRHMFVRANLAVTIATAEIWKWRSTHGRFPHSLDELSPTIPMDPFTDRPLGYKTVDNGFVVYSAGWDGNYQGDAAENPPAAVNETIVEARYPAR